MKFGGYGLAVFGVAAGVIACSAFSTTGDAAPAADGDAGTEAAPTNAGACVPEVVDAAAPPQCLDGRADLLMQDRMNCGQCGRACTLGECIDGQCAPKQLAASANTSIARIDTKLYLAHANDTDIGVVDLGAADPKEETFVIGPFTSPYRKVTAYDGKLWVSTKNDQAIIDASSKAVSANALIADANITENGGIFYPGAVAHYVYAALDASQTRIARYANGSVKDYGPYGSVGAVDAADGELAFASGVNVYRSPETHVIRSGTALTALGVTRDFVYFIENGFVIRAAADHADDVAIEPGAGVKLVVVGDTLYYAAHRIDPLRERDVLVRVKTCGGQPLVLYDHGGSKDRRLRDHRSLRRHRRRRRRLPGRSLTINPSPCPPPRRSRRGGRSRDRSSRT